MKKILLITTLLFGILNAQTIFTETFSDFRRSSGFLNLYIADSTSETPTEDLGTGSRDLTEIGDVVYELGSGLKVGGFHGTGWATTDYFLSANGTGNADTHFSIGVWFRRDNTANPNANMYLINNSDGGTLNNWALIYHNTSQTFRFVIWISNTAYNLNWHTSGSAFWNAYFDGNWHYVVCVHDGSTTEMYIDGVKSTNSVSASGSVDDDGARLSLGLIYNFNINPWLGELEQFFVSDTSLTAGQVRAVNGLPENWQYSNGNFERTLSNFYVTGWTDTILVPLSNSSLSSAQEWVLTSSNLDTVIAWIGSKSSAKSTKRTIGGGATFTSTVTYFGDGFDLNSDSLVVVFPADTASIDNIVLKKESHHLIRNVNRWITW